MNEYKNILLTYMIRINYINQRVHYKTIQLKDVDAIAFTMKKDTKKQAEMDNIYVIII